ncbi:MAG: thiamine pyrophosphate-dependent enzyme, partial [Candidatus Dormibacteria bacterium]
DDDQRRYRSAEDIEAERKQDCVPRLRAMLEDLGVLTAGDADAMRTELVAELDEATAYAENAADPSVDTVMLHVYGGSS